MPLRNFCTIFAFPDREAWWLKAPLFRIVNRFSAPGDKAPVKRPNAEAKDVVV
jgi:hypothetical protein